MNHASDTEDDEDDLVGSVLDGRYRIERRLGEGGMGLVYAAQHEVLKVRVAIKVLRAEASDDEEALERLRREAQSASQIGNQHIVDVRDFGQLRDGSTYVVMELIEGIDLFKETRPGPLPWQRATAIAVQICEALGAAHHRGIVHRDLKAENVLLTQRGAEKDFVKVVDFGIAKVTGSSKLTIAGRVMGTPEYMSPEQCEGESVDHRTDIYSLGVLLYEMVTGKLPFASRDLGHLIRMQLKETPVAPSKVAPSAGLPLGLEVVILRCLAKRPAERYQSMAEVADALVEVEPSAARWRSKAVVPRPIAPFAQRTLGDDDQPVPAPVVTDEETSGGARGLGVLGVVLAVVGLSAGAGAVFLMSTQSEIATNIADPGDLSVTTEAQGVAPPPTVDGRTVDGEILVGETGGVVATPATNQEIQIESEPPGAEVYENDALLGSTPLSVRRPPHGERWQLVLRQRGFRDHSVTIGAISGERVHIVLERGRSTTENTRNPVGEQPPGSNPPGRRTPEQTGERPFLDPWQNP